MNNFLKKLEIRHAKKIKFFVLKLFFISLIFTSNANSKSPPPGTISSADASKINVLLMLADGRHWDQERNIHI